MSKINIKCIICEEVTIVNGQKQADLFRKWHRHIYSQNDIEYRTGKNISLFPIYQT